MWMQTTKVTFNLPDDDVAALRRLAAARNLTVTAVLRQAIATEVFLNDALAGGSTLLVEKPDGTLRQLVYKV